ncbi:unnamed protein product [Paramecium sonneborni]|uniref:MORN repeat protein n=1 Tax=Paramecium sonneborni TaxID=65129 RepID=A0A8S1RLD6_9CILI|nr:unnamed protein product [Paramecium sonneborni]
MNQRCNKIGHDKKLIEYICVQQKPIQWACEKCYKENKQQSKYQSIQQFQECVQQAKQIIIEQTENERIEQMKLEFDTLLQKIKELLEFYLVGLEYQMNNLYEDLSKMIQFVNNLSTKFLESPNPDHYQYLEIVSKQIVSQKFDQFSMQTNQYIHKLSMMRMDLNEQVEFLSESIFKSHLETLIKKYDLPYEFIKQIELIQTPKQYCQDESNNSQYVLKDNIEGNICYIGQIENDEFNGNGLLFVENKGMAYYGTFIKGLFCQGIALNLKSKEVLQGEFEFLDLFCYRILNYGIYMNSDCERYEGEFKEGVFDGYGQFKYKNGDQYKGYWKDGKCYGDGELCNEEFGQITGKFENGKLNGQGQLNGLTKKYYGEFKNNEIDGEGTLEDLENKTKYVGQFKRGLKNGVGTLTFQDNRKIEGNFFNNEPSGKCKETITKKFVENMKQTIEVTVEIGEYINGLKCGQFDCEIKCNDKTIQKIKYYDQGTMIFEDIIT